MIQLQICRLGHALGAEVRGVDLRQPLNEATIAQIRHAWLDHLLLCFPDQNLEKDHLVAFTRRFGDDIEHNGTAPTRDPENPYLRLNTNQPIAGKPWSGYKGGQNWHSDRSYSLHPMLAIFLLAKELPDVGGDTMFANQYMAYELLSPTLREILEGLSAVHDTRLIKNVEQRGAKEAADYLRERPPVVHPVIRVHSETHRKTLFLGERIRQFVGMTEEESRPLLDFLNQHAVRHELTYRHRWRVNDLVMWDNRALLHIALSDYDLQRQSRHLWRTSLWGPKSGHFYDSDTFRSQREPVDTAAMRR